MSFSNNSSETCSELFEHCLAWLQATYHDHTFFVERDVVWTLQLELKRQIDSRGLPLRVFNDYAIVKGPRRGLCADLAVVDEANKVKVAAEFKYEPDHHRQDILPQKLPVVGWKDMEKDIARVRTFIEAGVIEVGYTVFIDEGGFFRRRDAHAGSDWVDWPKKGLRSAPSILFSQLTIQNAATIPSVEVRMADQIDNEPGGKAASQEDVDLSKKLHDAEQAQRDLQESGWVWQGDDPINRVLAHPDDPDIHIWFHPYTGEQLLSPKLVERLKQDVERERARAALPD